MQTLGEFQLALFMSEDAFDTFAPAVCRKGGDCGPFHS